MPSGGRGGFAAATAQPRPQERSKDWALRARKIGAETYARRCSAWQPTRPREKGTAREEEFVRRLLRLRRARVLRTRVRERRLWNHPGPRSPRRPDDVLLDAQRPGRDRKPDRDQLGSRSADDDSEP